jgi:two-component system sensor histidine kinase HydH
VLREQSLGTTLALGFACLLAIMAGVIAYSIHEVNATQLQRRLVMREVVPGVDAANQTALSAVRFEAALQAFLNSRAPDDLQEAHRSRERIGLALMDLQRLQPSDKEDQYLAAQLRSSALELQTQAQNAETYATGAAADVAAAYLYRYVRVTVASTVGASERLRDRLNHRSAEIRDQIVRREEHLTHSLILAFGLAGIVGVLLAVSCVRLVTEPVGRLSLAARAVEKGDYSLALGLGELMAGVRGTASQNELTVLSRAFAHMAGALEERESRLQSQTDRLLAANTQLTALQSLTDVALSGLPLNSLVEQLLQRVIAGVRGQAGAVFLTETSTGRLKLQAMLREEPTEGSDEHLGGGADLAARVAAEGKLVVCGEAKQHPDAPPSLVSRGVGAFLAVPIRVRDQVVGAAHVEFVEPQTFTPSAVNLMQVFEERLERALERTRALEELETWGHELERQIALKKDQLLRSERLASIGMLGGSIAHELRNPLGVISNAVYFLKTRFSGSDEKTQRHLEIIEREVEHSVSIIDSLVDFSTGIEPATTRLDLNQIIRTTLEFAPVPQSVTVELALEPDLPGVIGDESQLLQVVEHLVRNAVQAMEGKGHLRIATGSRPDRVWAAIQDSGPGVPAEEQSRIFEPLVTTRAKGIGLGLTMVRKILEAHEGEIRLVSEPGQGACFVVELPLTERMSSPTGSQANTASPPGA